MDKESQINAIIKYLGLEVCADTLVGSPFVKGISGRQKRRLSIGIEMVTQPGILFLDEVMLCVPVCPSHCLVVGCLCVGQHTL